MKNNEEMLCSIIIPLYNGKKFIEQTINSCLNQTHKNIEIIIINDCSTDNSINVIQKLLADNPNIFLIKNKNNLGISKTVNLGVTRAKGKYLLILGQDDLLNKDHIEKMLEEFDKKTAFVHCNAELIDKNGLKFGLSLNDQIQIKENRKFMVFSSFKNIVSSTGTIISKHHFDECGGWDEKYKNYGEWLIWIKLAHLGDVKYTTKVRSQYRRHDTNITNTFQNPEVIKSLEVFKNECRNLAKLNITKSSDKLLRNYIKYKNALKYRIEKIKN